MNTAKVVPVLILCLIATAAGIFIQSARENKRNAFASVLLTGVHHMGDDFQIADFYVDGYAGGNVDRGGGGGSDMCCVQLPSVWRRGMTVEIRWSVADWRNENASETDQGNFKSIKYANYKAIVPFEQYDEPHHVYAHFFDGGRIRIVASNNYPGSPNHPIKKTDMHARDGATVGTPITKVFTQAELDSLQAKMKVGNSNGWR